MPSNQHDASYFVERAPTIDFRDGLFHICYEIGRQSTFEIVMRPKVFAKARLLGSEACAKWMLEDSVEADNVTPMRGRRRR